MPEEQRYIVIMDTSIQREVAVRAQSKEEAAKIAWLDVARQYGGKVAAMWKGGVSVPVRDPDDDGILVITQEITDVRPIVEIIPVNVTVASCVPMTEELRRKLVKGK